MEDLPSSFDVIVLGTGMPESILAAAAARSGKSVLHLDQNDFYGGDWASFNFEQLNRWTKSGNETRSDEINKTGASSTDSYSQLAQQGEKIILLTPRNSSVINVSVHEYIEQYINDTGQIEGSEIVVSSLEPDMTSEKTSDVKAKHTQVALEESTATKTSSSASDKTDVSDTESDAKQDPETVNEQSNEDPPKQSTLLRPKWTIEEFHKQRRKFNLDLAPKLMFSKGALVELLIQSNISRYAEFKCSSQILTLMDDHLMPVPCSRADVFSTPHVSIVEKRMLMKLLKFCLEFENHPEEYQEYENKAFVKFLNSKKLTKNVEHYIIHSIAMVDPNTPTLDSLKQIQKFLQSLGRYGNSPFLFPLYGSGEMPQCFCRLCAVFGGIYCLKQSIEALIVNSDNVCVAAVVNNKRIDCKCVVMECGYASKSFLPADFSSRKLSKAVLITDCPVYPSDSDQLTFLRIPVGDNTTIAVNVLELGPSSNICPPGLRVVHMSCVSKGDSPEGDLLPAAKSLLNFSDEDKPEVEIQDKKAPSKPNVLWAMLYNQFDNSWLDLNESSPSNVFVLPTPDVEQDYEIAIDKAKAVFLKLFPDEEFLPRAPEPEEIVMDADETPKGLETGPEDAANETEVPRQEFGDCDLGGERQKEKSEPVSAVTVDEIQDSGNGNPTTSVSTLPGSTKEESETKEQ